MQSAANESLFGESFRPHLHFTPARNWINDPNGLLFYKGKYHLFYQHNPSGNLWGNMSWGHSVSTDLFHWEHLPVAIPCTDTEGIFSGSAVADINNTSGFGSTENPPLVAIYTVHQNDGTHQAQHIAYSLDEGITWTKYQNNPVLDLGMKDFRDPKVSWDAVNNRWLMVIAKPEEHKIAFFSSSNLKEWELLSDFGPLAATGGVWECPDLFSLKDNNGERQWILIVSLNPGGITGGSGTQYFIGQWDGKIFTTDQKETLWLDHGRDNYAGVTFNGTEEDERIFLAWMSNWEYANDVPTHIWRGSMTIPRELAIISTGGTSKLVLKDSQQFKKLSRSPGIGNALQLPSEIYISSIQRSFTMNISDERGKYIELTYDQEKKSLTLNRLHGWLAQSEEAQQNLPLLQQPESIQVIIDHGSIEISAEPHLGRVTSLHLLTGSQLQYEPTNGNPEIKHETLFTTPQK